MLQGIRPAFKFNVVIVSIYLIKRGENMFKKIITAVLATLMLLIVLPTKVLAEAPTEQSTENTNDTIDPEDIVDVEVIDGDLYIVVLEESQGYGMTRAIGECPSETKSVYQTKTRDELWKIKEKAIADQNAGAGLWGLLIGVANPLIGAAISIIGFGPNEIAKKIEDALNSNPSQSTFTVHTYFRCTASYSSVRGWAHHYKLIGFYVY